MPDRPRTLPLQQVWRDGDHVVMKLETWDGIVARLLQLEPRDDHVAFDGPDEDDAA